MLAAFALGVVLLSGFVEFAYRQIWTLAASTWRLIDPEAPEPHEHELPAFWVTLFDKVGEALIIAVVVGVTVEKTAREHFLKETERDALHNILGYDLPDPVKKQLQYILHLPFIRRNFKVVFTFEPQPTPDGDCWKVTSHTEYDVDNLTDEQQRYELNSSIERSRGAASLSNRLLDVEVTGLLHLNAAELERKALEQEKKEKERQEGPYRRVTVPIDIGPHGKLVHVKTERVAYYRLDDTMVLDILRPPCLGLEVCVKAPKELDVNVAFGVPGDVTHPHGHKHCWHHPGVHLPGAHFRVTWSHQKVAAGSRATVAAS